MNVLSYNIQACCGGERQHHLALWNYFKSKQAIMKKIATSIKKISPDIVGLVEVDAGSFRSKNQIEYFSKSLGYSHVSYYKYPQVAIPYLKHQKHAILSRHPILSVKNHHFSTGFKRSALEAVIQVGKKKITVIVTHLSLGSQARKNQLNDLLTILSAITGPVILMGDFNQANLTINGLASSGKAKTFPSQNPRQQLDYIFTRHVKVKRSSALGWLFSDHLPLYAELEF